MTYAAVEYASGSFGGPEGAAVSAGAFPSLAVEVAFDSQPGDAPVWTDITEYVRRVDITRGRSRELDRYQAGRLNLVLDNRDRRFDPTYGTNFLSSASAAFESVGAIGGWESLGFALLAQTTAQAKSGTGALQATNDGGTLFYSIQSEVVRVVEGRTYGFTLSSRAATAARSFTVTLRFWEDGSRTSLVDSMSDIDTDSTSAWVTASGSMVCPVGASRADLLVSWSSPGASEVHYVDEAGILDDTTTWSQPGPHTGKVLPMKRVRVRSTYAGTTHPLFDGYVDAWMLNYEKPNEAVVDLAATDAFKVLAAADLKSSAYTQDVSGDAPLYWFRLGEPTGSTAVFDSVRAIEGTVVGTATFGQTGLAGDDDTAVTMANANSGIRVTDPRAFITGTGQAFSVEALIRTSEAATEVIWQQDGTSSCQIRLRMLGTGLLEFQLTDTGSSYTAETESSGAVNDGTTHHIVASYSDANGLRVFVDGVNVSNVVLTDTGSPVITAFQMTLANDKSFLVNGWNGTLDEVAVYARELSTTEIADHAAAALAPWEGDTSGERVERVLDEIEWRDDLRQIETGESTLQAATLGGSVLEHLQKVTESEFGELYVSRDGVITFLQRSSLINLDNAATFGDSGSDLPYSEIGFDYSEQLIRNDVTIGRVDGAAQNVRDEGSIKDFLTQSFTRDQLLHDSDVLSRNAAEFVLSEYRSPLFRITQITIHPQYDPDAIFPVVLGRELGHDVTVKLTPPGDGAQIEQESRIEGISHTITPKLWVARWQLSAAYAGTCFFELDDGAGSAPCGLDDAALYF